MTTDQRYARAILFYVLSAVLFTYGATRYFVTRDLVATQIGAYRDYSDTETERFFAKHDESTYTMPPHLVELRETLAFSGSPYRFWGWMILCFVAGTGTAIVGFRHHWLASRSSVLTRIVADRWKWVAGLEFVGMCIVCSGLLWYAIFAERGMGPFTARNVGEFSHPREIAGAVVGTGGMILSLGYFGILVSSWIGLLHERKLLRRKPADGQHATRVVLQYMLLPLPFVLPFLVEFLYQPINEQVTVKYLGCGCCFGFNANSINFILWLQVLAVSSAMWYVLAKPTFWRHLTTMQISVLPWDSEIVIAAIGFFVLAFVVLQRYAWNYWM